MLLESLKDDNIELLDQCQDIIEACLSIEQKQKLISLKLRKGN